MFKEITKDNWLLFAQQNYDNPTLEKEEEFYDDIKRFKYLKRLFRKYEITGDIKIRLILNHLVVLQNVFGVEASVSLLLFKIDKEYWSILKTVFGKNRKSGEIIVKIDDRYWPILKTCLDYLGYLYSHELKEFDKDVQIEEMLKEL